MNNPSPFPFRLLHAGWGIADSAPCLFEQENYEYITVEFVVQGYGILESDGRRVECPPDSVYFLHRHSNHRYWTLPGLLWHKIFFLVDGPLADLLTESYDLRAVLQLTDVPQLRPCFEAMLELGHGGDLRANRRAAAIFHQFVESCAGIRDERTRTIRPEVAELKNALDRSTGEKFRLETFCRNAGFSETHLIRRFKEEFGCSPYEYRMRQRIEAAQRLLSYTQKSIKEIAAMLDFSDQYYFSGCFKERTGMSPSRFRQSYSSDA